MANREPATETIKASEARQQWSTLLNEVYRREKRVIVEKNGIPVAAIISPTDLERMQRIERNRKEDFKVIEQISAAFLDVPDDEIEREVAKAVQEAREQHRRYLRQREGLTKVISELRETFRDVPPEEIEREVEKAIAEVRSEYDFTDRAQSAV